MDDSSNERGCIDSLFIRILVTYVIGDLSNEINIITILFSIV